MCKTHFSLSSSFFALYLNWTVKLFVFIALRHYIHFNFSAEEIFFFSFLKQINKKMQFSTIRTDYLIRDTAVGSCVPGNEVRDQLLDPATVLGAEVFPRQPHVPVWTGPQHGEEGHEVTGPVHRKLCRRSCSTGDTGRQSEDKRLIQTAELDLMMWFCFCLRYASDAR